MSTRAAIGFVQADGSFRSIYCHYDGYPAYVGKILQTYHNSTEAGEALLEGSHIRNFDNDGTVVRFGEGDGGVEVFDSIEHALWSGYDYAYKFDGFTWVCYGKDHAPFKHIVEYPIERN